MVNTLRTKYSSFICWNTGELHAGGNTIWYRAEGDDNGRVGYIPAMHVYTTSAFDANPSAYGLPAC